MSIDLTDAFVSETLVAMQNHWKQSNWIRNLGASNIGEDCPRKIWLTWRYAKMPDFPPRILRLFDRGHREEPTLVAELKSAGVNVYGEQEDIIGYKKHFMAHPDGRAMGILEAPKTEHLLEFKTASDAKFIEMVGKGCKAANPGYYRQMQIQMHLTGLTRAFFLMVNKNDDHIYAERIPYDKAEGERLQELIEFIIDTSKPPEKCESYKCNWCAMKGLCEGTDTPELNCRTCVFSEPVTGGHWHCSKHDDNIPKEFQLKGCDKHLLIPGILEAHPIDTDEKTFIEYDNGLLNFNAEYVTTDKVNPEHTLTWGVPF